MIDLEVALAWLDMAHYYERFIQAGFDSWETLLEITEADLNALNVELGHRRKLQREIANTPRLPQNSAFTTPLFTSVSSSAVESWQSILPKPEAHTSSGKRDYRHHPKPDENAPQRPYSAYVLFSNHVREETKDRSLSFPEISKMVGERWQTLSPADKDIWKRKAAVPWEKYKYYLAEYKKTENFRNYQQYVADFHAAQDSKKNTTKPQGQLTHSSGSILNAKSIVPESAWRQSLSQNEMFTSAQEPEPEASLREQIEMPAKTPKRQDAGVLTNEGKPPAARKRTATTRIDRVSQACEPCRSRKSKCNGGRPVCKHCHDLGLNCHYQDGKKDKEKRVTEQLRRKITAYEDLLMRNVSNLEPDQQSALQRALLMPPEVERPENAISMMQQPAEKQEHGSDSGGESEASGVGSMGSTDRVGVDNLEHPEYKGRDQAFLGQVSDIQWTRKLDTELAKNPDASLADLDHGKQKGPSYHDAIALSRPAFGESKSGQHPDDVESDFIGDQVDPYGFPPQSTADIYVDSYFATIHPSFPVLDQHLFLDEYAHFMVSTEARASRYKTFVPILQVVLAIGATHAHLTHADWAGDERDHLLFFARAQALGGEPGLSTDLVCTAQVQTLGLSAMYFLATVHVNRAWNVLGLAIRCAQSMGMHLEYHIRGMHEEEKRFRIRIWHALASLERILSMVTGRPTMVKAIDCSVPALLPDSLPDEDSPTDASVGAQTSSPSSHQSRSSIPMLSVLAFGTKGPKPYDKPTEAITTTYFFYYLELNALSQRVLEGLYGPHIRSAKWSQIQDRVADFDAQLSHWSLTLPAALDIESPVKDPRTESFKVALALLSNSLRTIINRPSLCRHDRRVPHQSNSSVDANRDSATRCVSAARAVLALLPTRPDPQALRQNAVWWTLIHHIKRSVTVIMLEMAFRAKHMPSEAEELLADAKKGVNWLLSIASSSRAAKKSWETLSRLLKIAAQKIGGSTDDIIIAPAEHDSTRPASGFQAWTGYMPDHPQAFDPNIWEPMDWLGSAGNPFSQEAPLGGYLDSNYPSATRDMFPFPSDINGMAFQQQIADEGYSGQEGALPAWFGFDPGPYPS